MRDNGIIEAFRGDDAEVFYQALTLIRHSRNFLSGIQRLLLRKRKRYIEGFPSHYLDS
jgi:hypothetical protein